MFKNKIEKYFRRTGEIDEICWTFEKPMASLSTCHCWVLWLDGNLVKKNISKELFLHFQLKRLINEMMGI